MPALTDPISLHARLGDPQTLAAYLQRPGVLHVGHFRLLSGLHSEHFLAFSAIASDDEATAELVALLTPTIGPWEPTAVLAPSTAGVSLGRAIASEFGIAMHLASLDEGGRPQGIVGDPEIAGERVLLVNDVVTTGEGIVALARAVRTKGAEVAGATWFASRTDVDVAAMIEAPVAFAAELHLPAVSAADCPACARDVKLEDGLDLN